MLLAAQPSAGKMLTCSYTTLLHSNFTIFEIFGFKGGRCTDCKFYRPGLMVISFWLPAESRKILLMDSKGFTITIDWCAVCFGNSTCIPYKMFKRFAVFCSVVVLSSVHIGFMLLFPQYQGCFRSTGSIIWFIKVPAKQSNSNGVIWAN